MGRPHSVLLILLLKRLIHIVCGSDFHVDDHFPPLASRISPQPHEVGLELRTSDPSFVLPFLGQQVLSADSDFVPSTPHRLPILPLLLVGDQSSLDEDIIQEYVQDDVMASDDFAAHFPAAADVMLCVQLRPSLAAPALCVGFLLGDHLPPLSHAEEVLLDLTNHLHRFR